MAYTDTDTVLNVYQTVEDNSIGHRSRYVDEVHPGTNKKIEGWKWNERTWATEGEFRATAHAPSIWDPTISGLDDEQWQSGYGDNKDLLLLGIEDVAVGDDHVWAPRVHHGYFYARNEEWYLYSDSYLTEYFNVSGVESGRQVLTLTRSYKPTIPIQVRSYKFDKQLARHTIYRDFRRKVEFSNDPDGPEFTIDTTTNPPKIILDGMYSQEIGQEIILSVSGTADPTDIYALEILGTSDGTDEQEFPFLYSPVDPSGLVQIWSWVDPNFPLECEIIDPLDDFVSGVRQVKLDRDRGIVTFGTVGETIVPAGGYQIGAHYTVCPAVIYEPADTVDSILAYSSDADINPITSAISRGFVQLSTKSIDPATIELSSDLVFQSGSYSISLGNSVGQLIAEVKGIDGNILEGQQVTFEILDPQIGSFGTAIGGATAITGPNGKATTLYNSPRTIQGLGRATTDVVYDSGDTIITVDGVVEPNSVDDLFIFKVHALDEVLGIPASGVNSYYESYLDDEGMKAGLVQPTQEYEEEYRTLHELGIPIVYENDDYVTGKKTIMLTTRGGTMNPHTGSIESGILVPLYPDSIENIGSTIEPTLRMRYGGVELTQPWTGDTKAYFIIGNAKAFVQAYVTNQRTRQRIYSNIINIEVNVPALVNGTYYCDVLNDIPAGLLTAVKNVADISDASINATSGVDEYWKDYIDERMWNGVGIGFETYLEWFRRTKRGDTVGLTDIATAMGNQDLDGISGITPIDCPSEIPLGFRLKSTGVTIASILDQVTYLDPNDHLPSGYWE